ncbi:refilin B [Stegostoma tigrinum]|uniref:refilin B n=1 Tax=Stegostoma tigrinum TaxID=3053191 RepID=UPI00202BA300|nr:refilin B [Stegostoma tigrinum]XP_048413268.1 refilin B [Stegostoma tigrinum]XP_048413269.1 refilin B [Stegostoma tigrinum]XP_059511266.1 refilin B [Stegostoma tigrinum]
MVGSLNLQEVTGPLVEPKRLGERVLDSPDSGLPPSPSPTPSAWLPSPGGAENRLAEQEDAGFPQRRGQSLQTDAPVTSSFLITGFGPRLHPLSFGEGVEVDPLPPKAIRYTSSVKYDSDRHYVNNILLQHTLGVDSCSQTVICVPNCTWRNYKTELRFEPQHKPWRFRSTIIVYPKYAKTVYTTTVDYNCRKAARKFLSSVELEATDYNGSEMVFQDSQ